MNSIGTPLIVLGMHRSGTSLLAGTLHNLGVYLGEDEALMGAQEDVNAKGFWEHERIVAIHDEIFTVFGLHWNQIASLPDGWYEDELIEPYRKSLIEIIRTEFSGKGMWGIKDPRMCRLLPLWLSIFEELKIKPKFIFIVRHPYEVAASLEKRDGDLSWQYYLYLWIKYSLDAEEYSAGNERAWLTYEQLSNDWQATMSKVGNDLGIEWPRPSSDQDVKKRMSDLVTKGLWHNKSAELLEKYSDDISCVLELHDVMSSFTHDLGKELERLGQVRIKVIPQFRLIDQSMALLEKKYLDQSKIITTLVEQREDFSLVNKALREENTLLVQQREDFSAMNEELLDENKLLVQQRDELISRLNSGAIGFLNRLLK